MKKLILLFLLIFMVPVKAETLNIVVHRTGIGPAINAQILSKYLMKHNPEITSVVIKVVPGAGGITAANYLYEIAPKDGLTIGTIPWHVIIPEAPETVIKYDPLKFTWLGSTIDGRKDAILLITNTDNITNIGFQRADHEILTRLISSGLNRTLRPIVGYKDQNEVKIAFERREVDSLVNSYSGMRTMNPEWLTRRSPLLQFGNGTNRHSDFPNVPTLMELLTDNNLKRTLDIYEKQATLLRPFVAPPGLSHEISVKLRNTFARAATDAEYIAEAKKANIDVSYVTWEEAESIVKFLIKSN